MAGFDAGRGGYLCSIGQGREASGPRFEVDGPGGVMALKAAWEIALEKYAYETDEKLHAELTAQLQDLMEHVALLDECWHRIVPQPAPSPAAPERQGLGGAGFEPREARVMDGQDTIDRGGDGACSGLGC